MKKLLSLLTIVMLAIGFASAEPVDVQTAKKIAQNQYRNYAPASNSDYSVKAVYTNDNKGLATYYTFTFNAGGFVIVSADDAVVPVLGYSHDSEMDVNNLNPNIQFWLSQYDNNIAEIVSKKLSNTETRKEWDAILENNFPKSAKAVTPIFNITWGQGSGYDTYCPTGTPVGCVATAMAMIMRHYEFPATGEGWHKYTHPTYGTQSAFFSSTTYNYAAMPTNTGSTGAATLGYHLGVAVDMNYGPSASGAFSPDVPYVMANYFKYDQGIQHVDKSKYSDAEWITLLKGELNDARPIYYSGSGNDGGHAFLCLGYNDADKFYFNWGWNGSANGYFTMGALNTSNGSFNTGNAAVIHIKPSIAGEEQMLWVKKYTNFPIESTYPGYISAVNESVAWAMGRDGSGGQANYRVFSVTTDGGASWVSGQAAFGTAFSMIHGIDANTAYVAAYGTGTGNKIIKTTNRGLSWESVLSGAGANSFFNVVHFFDENNGFVQGDPEGGYFELYTTSNAGATWTRVPQANIPPVSASGECGIVGHYTAVGNTIWYTTNNGYVYKSTDKGLNWTKFQIFATTNMQVNTIIAFNDEATEGISVAFVDGDYRKFKTEDGGATWIELTSTAPDNFYNSDISAVPGSNMFVSAGADYQNDRMGISYTRDGGDSWTDYAQYYKGHQVVSISMVNENKGYAGGFQSTFSGGAWVLGGTSNMAANFSADILKACVGQEVTYTNLSFGEYTSIEWDFGEGATPATANTDGPHTVTYATGGNKTVSVVVSDGSITMPETKPNFVQIVTPPVADFTFEINSGNPRLVSFNASSSTGVIAGAKYYWNLREGVTLMRLTPLLLNIDLQSLAVHTITLTIENIEGGCSDAITKTVDNTVSIEEHALSQMAIYPNPANSVLTVANVNGAFIEIYTMDGRLAYQAMANSDIFEINVESFKNGLYSIKVIKENEATTTIVAIQ
ncbi:MAG: C10 family peptidase [Salinivirgaceae bacterium]|nr:C10 family peptidase [Salinivirgaceae bacterium]